VGALPSFGTPIVAQRHRAHSSGMSREDDIARRVGPADAVPYEELHAVVVGSMRYITSGQTLEEAAHLTLQRLRECHLPIPVRPPDDPFVDGQ
jgi:hypothetical protein